MRKEILFIHGAGDEGYEQDKTLVASLRTALGGGYNVGYPHVSTNEDVSDFDWPKQIHAYVSAMNIDPIVVGHSLGASMLLKCLCEDEYKIKAAGVFLLSTPFWSGSEEWKKGLLLGEDFARKLPKGVPIFFYHCRDDEEVSFSQMENYERQIPWAKFRRIARGGHQLNSDLTAVADDIKSSL